MRVLLLLILCFVFSYVPTHSEAKANRGQENITYVLVTWKFGTKTGKTKRAFLNNNVYLDTSATGQAGSLVRIDNTADSCSVPFPLVADTAVNNMVFPTYLYLTRETVRGVAGINNSHSYRVQTRDKVYDDNAGAYRYTPWTQSGMNSGYSGFDFKDVLTSFNTGVSEKITLHMAGRYIGTWARLCPDDNVETANGASDTAWADSTYHQTR